MGKRLTDRQRRFVEEYPVDCNATAAAIRAGYGPKCAGAVGSRLKGKPEVRAALAQAFREKREAAGVDRDRIVAELARIAFADVADLAAWDGDGVRLKTSEDLAAALTACVAEVSETGAGGGKRVRVKLHNKNKALETLCRLFGLYDEAGGPAADRIFEVVTRAPAPGNAEAKRAAKDG